MDIKTYRNHLRRKLTRSGGIRSDASVNREISCLHHLFQKAVEWELMEKNPFERGGSLILKEKNERLRFLTENEIQRLLDALKDRPHLRRIVICALNTGMRKDEILGLKWDQIRNGFTYLTKTKTKDARQIPINETMEALFKEIRSDKELKSEYVFTYPKRAIAMNSEPGKLKVLEGRILDIKTAFNAALRRAGIEGFTFHDLRHTFASHLIMRGAGPKDVQELLGHKTLKMTLPYAHLAKEHKKKGCQPC